MPPQKRKRLHDDLADSTAQPAKPQSQEPARRVTRQNPKGLLDEEKHHLRSGRVRANTLDKSAIVNPAPERARASKHDAPKTEIAPPADIPVKQTRQSKHTSASTGSFKENIRPPTQAPTDSVATTKPLKTVLPSHTASSPPGKLPKPPKPPRAQPRGAPSKPAPQKPTSQKQQPIPSSSAVAAATATALATPKRTLGEKPLKPPPTPRSDRNIDKVVLGDICFKAWYPSYYGKEVLGDVTGNAGGGGGGKDIGARMGGGKRDPPMLDRLYVCPCCFKYSKELVSWWEHVRCCEQKGVVPGRKVYTHPKGTGVRKIKTTAATDSGPGGGGGGRGKGKKKVDAEPLPPVVEEKIKEEGEWSVWEVDGEDERNLSLFAKLFLDNKSVFFDVSGFNYFLLVYTPPPHNNSSSCKPGPPLSAPSQQDPQISSTTSKTNQDTNTPPPAPLSPRPRPQIVGFFSKEKMSWDNNNLACILVFPPWQRKGLGSILMGVSYEISRREGILGGPEKPISELGRKGYKRFWAGEIARWLLSSEVMPSSSPSSVTVTGANEEEEEQDQEKEIAEEQQRQGQARAGDPAETTSSSVVVDIQKCSRATWIVPEDCLLVLREMGVVEEAAPGPASGDVAAASAITATDGAAADGAGESTPVAAIVEEGGAAVAVVTAAAAKDVATKKLVPRVRIDKAAVRRWVAANKIELERTCDPAGFLEGYAIKKTDSKKIKIITKMGADVDAAAPADGVDVVG